MILIPLACTAQLLRRRMRCCRDLTQLVRQLCLIHSGSTTLGTMPSATLASARGRRPSCAPSDIRRCNYGHTMMWWDRIAGTYKYPETVRTFNRSKERFVLGGSDYKVEERGAGAGACAAASGRGGATCEGAQ